MSDSLYLMTVNIKLQLDFLAEQCTYLCLMGQGVIELVRPAIFLQIACWPLEYMLSHFIWDAGPPNHLNPSLECLNSAALSPVASHMTLVLHYGTSVSEAITCSRLCFVTLL